MEKQTPLEIMESWLYHPLFYILLFSVIYTISIIFFVVNCLQSEDTKWEKYRSLVDKCSNHLIFNGFVYSFYFITITVSLFFYINYSFIRSIFISIFKAVKWFFSFY